MEFVTVADARIPALGLGTARMTGDDCRQAVGTALELGYRHVDTAQMYDNEEAVGDAIAEADVEREDVFLVTKVNTDNLRREDVLRSTRRSLDRLDTDYADLLLIHAPRKYAPISETIGAMNELQDDGAVRHVGVSNFSVDQLREAMDASRTPIVTNQVKYHPYTDQSELLAFCVENDVTLTAYSPLARGDVASDDALAEIGGRHGKTPSQVALRWLLQQEHVIPIPKAASRDHQRENLDVFDFRLSDDEMERIFEQKGGLTHRLRSLLGL